MKIDASVLPQIEKMIKASTLMKKRVKDLSPIAEDLAVVVRDDIKERFDSSPRVETGGLVYGDASWPRLTDYTLRKHPHRRGGKILIDTGELRKDCISDTAKGNRYYVQKPGFFSYILTSKKAVENQEKRPILFMHRGLAENLSKTVVDYVQGRKQ